MSATSKSNNLSTGFIPEDFVQRKVEGRTGILMVILFCIVMLGVTAAFFVTHRERAAVRGLQEQINSQFAAEAKKIEQLKVLETQKSEMVGKAEITTALIEKVPRSILMAEVVNRMPPDLTLTELNLISKKIVEAPPPGSEKKPAPRSIAGKTPQPKAAAKDASKPPERPKPPKYEYALTLIGLAKTDEEIADFTAALSKCALLDKVEFKFSGDVIIEEAALRKFRLEAVIKPSADARLIEPLHVDRLIEPGTQDRAQRTAEDRIKGVKTAKGTKPASGTETATVPESKEETR